MIKSVTTNIKTGEVKYKYCKMHIEYPNCVNCPLKTNNGYCLDWIKEEIEE